MPARKDDAAAVCPHCGKPISRAQVLAMWGATVLRGSTSERKAKAARENGKKGGAHRKLRIAPK